MITNREDYDTNNKTYLIQIFYLLLGFQRQNTPIIMLFYVVDFFLILHVTFFDSIIFYVKLHACYLV